MNQEQADDTVDYLDRALGVEAEVRDKYSGRGMYGDSVLAIVIDSGDEMAIGYVWRCLGFDYDDLPSNVDNFGLRIVLY